MTTYFCWEKSACGIWAPVCYHGSEPAPLKVSKGDEEPRSAVVPVPADCVGEDGTPNFGMLTKRFPLRRAS